MIRYGTVVAVILLVGCIDARHRITPEIISTEGAPAATGPFSQALRVGDALYVSGQTGRDPKTGKITEGGIEAQTHLTLKNIGAILNAAGFTFADVVQSHVFLTDMDQYKAMNAVYASYFPHTKPARATVQVVRLPGGALVEIMVTAIKRH